MTFYQFAYDRNGSIMASRDVGAEFLPTEESMIKCNDSKLTSNEPSVLASDSFNASKHTHTHSPLTMVVKRNETRSVVHRLLNVK